VNVISSISSLQNTLAFLYSDESMRSTNGWQNKVTYCKVKKDATTGTRYFYFRFRRYIYDETLQKFIPGFMDVTQDKSIGSWLDTSYLHQGLSHEEAARRLGVVGPNVLDLKKPTILSSILNEFSKLFYLYQTFMVWTWGKMRILSISPHYFLIEPLTIHSQRTFSTLLVLLHGNRQHLRSSNWWPCGGYLPVHE
jgi:hypothetical protein